MPLFDYSCECGRTAEHMVRHRDVSITCPMCGGTMERMFTPPTARTPSLWGDEPHEYGINGKWDRALRTRIKSAAHRRRIMKERGLVSEADMSHNERVRIEEQLTE